MSIYKFEKLEREVYSTYSIKWTLCVVGRQGDAMQDILTRMIEVVPGGALSGRGAPAVLGRVVGRVVGLLVAAALGLRVEEHVLGLFALLAAAAHPARLEGREKGVRALCHRHMAMGMTQPLDHPAVTGARAMMLRRAAGR